MGGTGGLGEEVAEDGEGEKREKAGGEEEEGRERKTRNKGR